MNICMKTIVNNLAFMSSACSLDVFLYENELVTRISEICCTHFLCMIRLIKDAN